MTKSQSTEQDTEIIALDTNILLYAVDKSAGKKHELCKELLTDGFRGNVTYFVPVQALSEFFYVISRGKVKADIDYAEEIVRYIIELPNFITAAANEFSTLEAIQLHKKFGTHYWDALIIAVMRTSKVNRIYTENTKHTDIAGIEAINPFV
jgi:predicted nucleic acid-binding protein